MSLTGEFNVKAEQVVGSRQWATVKEAMGIMGVSRSVVYRLLWSKKIKHAQFGRAIRILRSDLERYVSNQTVAPTV